MSGAEEIEIDNAELKRMIEEVIKSSNGLRPAARLLKVDPSYLKRLCNGEKNNPSPLILRKLRLRRVVNIKYERRK